MENDSSSSRLPHPSFTHPDDLTSKVWRYMDLAKLVSLLSSRELFLTSLSNMEDPHEGCLATGLVKPWPVLKKHQEKETSSACFP